MESFKDAWDMVCGYCKTRITDVAYNLWIGKIEPINMDFTNKEATLLVQNEFHKQALSKGYAPPLKIYNSYDYKSEIKTKARFNLAFKYVELKIN